MAVFIPYLWSILSAVSDNPSTYGITANPLLSCADLFHLRRGNQLCYSFLGLAYQPPARQDCQNTSIPQAHTYGSVPTLPVSPAIHHKSGVVRTLMDRKDTLVSTEDDKDTEELHIRNALKSIGFLTK